MIEKKTPRARPVPLAMDHALLARLDAVAAKLGEGRSLVARMAMRIGLDGLEQAMDTATPDFAKIIALAAAAEKSDPSDKSEKSETRYPTPHELQKQNPALNDPKQPSPVPGQGQGVSPETAKKIVSAVKKHVRPPAGRRSAARPPGKAQPAPPPAPAPEAP